MTKTIASQTIDDFGSQWTHYPDNEGFYGSLALFEDYVSPLVAPSYFAGKRVADIGSGTGRIVAMLLEAGAAHVTAIEPSDAYQVLVANTARFADRVRCLKLTGDGIPPENYEAIISLGVVHHVPEPLPLMQAAYRALAPGGEFLIWVYGREGNGAYLTLAQPLRAVAASMPHRVVATLAAGLDLPLRAYIAACGRLRLPLGAYMRNVLGKCSPEKRRLIIYDQLRPAYAKYYRRHEVVQLFEAAGFTNIRLHHRHGYSWTAIGRKPA